jgi:F0F1-type ATP synthase assembly protein I
MAGSGRRPDSTEEEIRVGWQMAGLGFETVCLVLGGVALGWIFDRWRGTGTTGILVGAITGIAVALWILVSGSLRLNRRLEQLTRRRRESAPPPEPAAGDPDEPTDRPEEEADDWDRRWAEKWDDDEPEPPA